MGFPPQWWKPEQPLGSWGRWGRRWISCGLDSEGKAQDWLPSRGWHLVMVTRSILSQQATWRTEMGQASVMATLLPRSERKPTFPRSQMWSKRTLSLGSFSPCFAGYCLTHPSRQMKGAVPHPQSFPVRPVFVMLTLTVDGGHPSSLPVHVLNL